jgi:PAS domain S-box-containing protein
MIAPLPANEPERLAALREMRLLDTPPEQAFDDIAQLAAEICGTPISLVSLVDEHRQWFKAKVGIAAVETSRDASFCAHAILQPGELFMVPDAQRDPRFHLNQLVVGEPYIGFYAGMPLTTSGGHSLGTLCVIDRRPRELTAAQMDSLRRLARQLGAHLELSRLSQRLAVAEDQMQSWAGDVARTNLQLHSEMQERERIGNELREREEQLRDLFENATDLIQSVAPDGRLLFVNRAWLNTLGYRASELTGLTIFDIIHPDCLVECRAVFERVLKGEALNNLQALFRAKDGHAIHVEGNASCRFENGRPVATRAIFRDISKRKAIEAERERLIQELQSALAEVQTLSGLLPVCGWCKKIRDDSGYWNNVETYLKRSSGMEITHGICPECSAKVMADMDRALIQ